MDCIKLFSLVGVTATLLSAALLLAGCGGPSGSTTSTNTPVVAAPEGPFTYDAYDALLNAYVSDEGVNYVGLKADRADLDGFVAAMGAIEQTTYDGWSEDEQLALWINAYNAITLKYIIDNYPIEKGGIISGAMYPANSIRQISGVWDTLKSAVVGKERTLEAIEHEILRTQFDEPRIHVAIVCASVSCPPLRNEAFAADRLDEQLADQSRQFLASDNNFRIERADGGKKGRVLLSAIFDWFGGDFVNGYAEDGPVSGHSTKERAVLNFVSAYIGEADARYLATESYGIGYQKYDWSLNER